MIKDLLNSFGEIFQNSDFIKDIYTLENGEYYLVDKSGKYINLSINKEHQNMTNELYDYFAIRDYYSKYLDNNKSVDTSFKENENSNKSVMGKKVVSNNIYSLFFKARFVQGLLKDSKEENSLDRWDKCIDKYYESLAKLKSNYLEKEYEEVLEEYIIIKEKMKRAFNAIIEDVKRKELKKDTYIKIFLDYAIEEYDKESNYYLSEKIFNTVDYNVVLNNKLYGANNYNFGLNSKKKYLELKSTSYKVGSLVSEEEIRQTRNLYIWLIKNVATKNYVKIPIEKELKINPELIENKNVYILRAINDNGNAKIEHFEIVPNYSNVLKDSFVCNNYIMPNIEIKENNIITNKLELMEKFVSNIWFSGYLERGYFDFKIIEEAKILTMWKKQIIKRYGKVFFNYFNRNNKLLFIQNLDNIGIEIVINSYYDFLNNKETGKIPFNVIKVMNLYLALDEYLKGKEGSINMRRSEVTEKAKEVIIEKGKINTDDLYYFVAGQVAQYLLSLSNASRITQDKLNALFSANSVEKIKKELTYIYNKYNYNLGINYERFNNVFSQLMTLEPEFDKTKAMQMLIAGVLTDNIFYTSIKDVKEEE